MGMMTYLEDENNKLRSLLKKNEETLALVVQKGVELRTEKQNLLVTISELEEKIRVLEGKPKKSESPLNKSESQT